MTDDRMASFSDAESDDIPSSRRQWGVLIAGAIAFVGLALGSWLLLDHAGDVDDAGSGDPACEPVTERRATKAVDRFANQYARSGFSPITGAGASREDDGWFILATLRLDADSAEFPDCFRGVPVHYLNTGPFQGG